MLLCLFIPIYTQLVYLFYPYNYQRKLPMIFTMNAASHAIAQLYRVIKRAHLPPASFFMAAIAAMQGMYISMKSIME